MPPTSGEPGRSIVALGRKMPIFILKYRHPERTLSLSKGKSKDQTRDHIFKTCLIPRRARDDSQVGNLPVIHGCIAAMTARTSLKIRSYERVEMEPPKFAVCSAR